MQLLAALLLSPVRRKRLVREWHAKNDFASGENVCKIRIPRSDLSYWGSHGWRDACCIAFVSVPSGGSTMSRLSPHAATLARCRASALAALVAAGGSPAWVAVSPSTSSRPVESVSASGPLSESERALYGPCGPRLLAAVERVLVRLAATPSGSTSRGDEIHPALRSDSARAAIPPRPARSEVDPRSNWE